jgi:hypothetical protein
MDAWTLKTITIKWDLNCMILKYFWGENYNIDIKWWYDQLVWHDTNDMEKQLKKAWAPQVKSHNPLVWLWESG